MYDDLDDVPRGYGDADIEQAGFEELGRRSAAARRAGVCLHGWTQGVAFPEEPDRGPCKCLEDGCGATWPTSAAYWAERDDLVAEWL